MNTRVIQAIAVGVECRDNGQRVNDEVAVVLRLPPGVTIQRGDLLIHAPKHVPCSSCLYQFPPETD